MWNQGALWKLRMGHRLQWGSPARHRPLNFAIWKMGGICLSNSLQRQILRGIPMLPAWPSLVTGARRGHPSNQDLDFNREPTQGSRRTGRAAVGQEMEMLSDVYFYRHPGGRGWVAGGPASSLLFSLLLFVFPWLSWTPGQRWGESIML